MRRTTGLRDVAIWLAKRARFEKRHAYFMKKSGDGGYFLGLAEGRAEGYRHAFTVALNRLKKGQRR